MIFLRPVVLRDADSTGEFSVNRYQQMIGKQLKSQPGFNPALNVGGTPLLPPMPTPKSKDSDKADTDVPPVVIKIERLAK
jgi:general secretion pathway protein D